METGESEFPPVVPVQPAAEDKPKSDHEGSEEELRVVPKLISKHIGKKKHRKLNSLDVNSEDEVDSDESFKGDR